MRSFLILVALLSCMAATRADNALEERVQRMTEHLRCLVCQNQTVAESHSPLANDLRQQVRTQFAAGRDEQQVIDFMVQRYGDFILYRPPVRTATLLLWFGPFVLLLVACAALFLTLRRRGAHSPKGEAALTPAELAQAEALLHKPGTEER
jgi:cytochrome c-type biogenesis protein CcmH